MDPVAIGLDAIAHERERYAQAPSAAGAATLAKLHAQVALSQLLEGAVQPAQATLTEALDLGAQLPQSSHATLKNDLAICALHDGRPADALPLLERALQLLPDASGALQPSMLRSRAQLQLNLCEALLLRGSLEEAVQSATEAVRLSEMALPRGEREIEGVRKTGLPSPCHYHDKYAHPVKPVAGTVGNARLDALWLGRNAGGGPRSNLDGRVEVKAIVDVAGCYPFLALHGAKLPPPTRGAPPLASGFYPTDLAASFHAHRERWTFYHTQLVPSMPSSRSLPMVGTFLTGGASVVYLDGVRLKIEAR